MKIEDPKFGDVIRSADGLVVMIIGLFDGQWKSITLKEGDNAFYEVGSIWAWAFDGSAIGWERVS